MKHHNPLQHKRPGLQSIKWARRDYLSAQLVEIGIVIQRMQGTEYAAQYLMSKKVDFDVALRVLSHPTRRRIWSELTNPDSTAKQALPSFLSHRSS